MFGDKPKAARNGTNIVETLIGPRVTIRGDVHFSGGLYVEGRILGKVIAEEGAPAVLTIAPKGRVEGEVRAPVVVICGELAGDVHADQRIELGSQARVTGTLHYQLVEMAAGATVTGRLIHAEAPLAQVLPAEAAFARAS